MSDVPASPAVCGWVKLYHPCGALVTLPVVGQWREKEKGYDYSAAFSAVSDAIGCGFSVNAPGLEDGEVCKEVGFVVRREKENADRSLTPIIDLYSTNPAESFKFLSKYLNRDSDIDDFEKASGLKLTDLKVFPGASPERGKNRQAEPFIVKVKPFPVVIQPNPNYDEEEAAKATATSPYKVPRREFVRWPNVPDRPSETKVDHPREKPNMTAENAIDGLEVRKWVNFLNTSPNAAKLERECKEALPKIGDKWTKRACWREVEQYMESAGIEFDRNKNTFHDPVDVSQDDATPAGQAIPF